MRTENVRVEEAATIENLELNTRDLEALRTLYHQKNSTEAARHVASMFVDLVGHGPYCDC